MKWCLSKTDFVFEEYRRRNITYFIYIHAISNKKKLWPFLFTHSNAHVLSSQRENDSSNQKEDVAPIYRRNPLDNLPNQQETAEDEYSQTHSKSVDEHSSEKGHHHVRKGVDCLDQVVLQLVADNAELLRDGVLQGRRNKIAVVVADKEQHGQRQLHPSPVGVSEALDIDVRVFHKKLLALLLQKTILQIHFVLSAVFVGGLHVVIQVHELNAFPDYEFQKKKQ